MNSSIFYGHRIIGDYFEDKNFIEVKIEKEAAEGQCNT
jgi:hypothetical protein